MPTLAQFKIALIGLLIVACCVLGGLLHHQIGETASYRSKNNTLTQQLEVSQGQTKLAQESCKTGDIILGEVATEAQKSREKVEVLVDQVVQAAKETVPPTRSPDETKATTVVPTAGRLDPNLVKLLDQSYCNANPTSRDCTPVKPAGKVSNVQSR